MADYLNIAGRIRTTASDGVAMEAQEVKDLNLNKSQQEINTDVQTELGDRYTKEETYSKEQLDDLITTPDVNYVSVVATNATTAVTDILPATGEANTIYRVGNWNGTQYDPTMYALFAWNGTTYVCVAVRSFVGEVYDVSVNHPDGQGNPTPYADLTAALGTDGENIPADIRRGGMRIQFIKGNAQSSDNKYVQYRLMATTWSTNVSDWQEVNEPIQNPKRFYDTRLNSYNTPDIAKVNDIIREMYIDGEPFDDDNPLEFSHYQNKKLYFIRKNDAGYYFVRGGAHGMTLEKYTLGGRTYYMLVNWDAEPWNIDTTHSNVIISDGCYYAENNPAINTAIFDIATLQSDIVTLQYQINSKRFYDLNTNTYNSAKIAYANKAIVEMYVDGEDFGSDNPLEFVHIYQDDTKKVARFIRRNESGWAFVINEMPTLDTIKLHKVTYQGRTLYILINWNAIKNDIEDTHTGTIVSDGCFVLDNNPAISAYIKNEETNTEIVNVNNSLQEDIRDITDVLFYDSEIPSTTISALLQTSRSLRDGVIYEASSVSYGVVFIPVSKGDALKITIESAVSSNLYDIVCFCTSTAVGTSYTVIEGKKSGTIKNVDVDYVATQDGYVAIWKDPNNDVSIVRVYKMLNSVASNVVGLIKGDCTTLNSKNLIPYLTLSSDRATIQNNQTSELFNGKVSNITIDSVDAQNRCVLYAKWTSVNELLKQYSIEENRKVYPIKFGCKVYNQNNHDVKFIWGVRYKLSGEDWVTPSVEKTISANSSENFELIVNLDLRNTFTQPLDLFSKFTTGCAANDTFILGDTYMIFYDSLKRNPEFIDTSLLSKPIEESQLSNDITEKLNSNLDAKQHKRIICSGSSITWGSGALDGKIVGFVDDFMKTKLSSVVLPANMTFSTTPDTITNDMLYKATGMKISSLNDTVEFDSYGDEIAICQMKRRTKTDYGIMNVYADNVLIGKFDNKNFIGTETETFSGESIREIRLKHPCTFNHNIIVNGSTTLTNIVYNTGGYGSVVPDPSTFEAFVFRGLDDNGLPIHRIQFSTDLGTITSVSITYDYGNIVAHERSTLGQTTDEYTNESYYGSGSVAYDPDHPTNGIESGMEFKAINKESFFIHKFDTPALRHFKIELVGGNNPYFIINFATNRYHDLMNAGIGGWTILGLINDDKNCDYTQFFKWFKPELIFQESETNDDWSYSTRRIKRSIGEISLADLRKLPWLEVHTVTYNSSTDKYAVEMCTGIIDSITYTSLTSQHIVGTSTQVGDIVRIGTYHGDIKQFTCRRISEVNLTTGQIKWKEPLSVDEILNVNQLSDLVGAEINIRDLSDYKTNYKSFIEKVHEIASEAKIVVADNALPMLGTRQLWGYDVIHREIVNESINCEYLDVRTALYDAQFEIISGTRKENITVTGDSTYNLSFSGSDKAWIGFKVFVNGVDVYGRDCYIDIPKGYKAKTTLSGESLNKTSPYQRTMAEDNNTGYSMKLVFTQNVPTSGDTVEVWYADEVWSGDFTHPSDGFGARTWAQAYTKMLE